ncbi:MAG TPA: hypothetical protein PLY42_00005, partial [Nitrospira sp.]|nr:hypothetical protein [Nitrospira sp.]HNK77787.1 hypothetical protein [Nitrospira sp.]
MTILIPEQMRFSRMHNALSGAVCEQCFRKMNSFNCGAEDAPSAEDGNGFLSIWIQGSIGMDTEWIQAVRITLIR